MRRSSLRGRIAAYIVMALALTAMPARLDAQHKGVAKCDLCRDAAETYNNALARYEQAVRQYNDAKAAMDGLWEQKWADERELRRKRGTATNRGRLEHLQMLEERIAAAPAAIDQASKAYAEAYSNMQDALREVGRTWVALVRCNQRCTAQNPAEPPINVTPDTTSTSSATSTTSSDLPMPVCDACDGLLEELRALEARRQETQARVDANRQRRDELAREMRDLYERQELLASMRQSGDASLKLSDQDYKSRSGELDARLKQLQDGEMKAEVEALSDLLDELVEIEKGIRDWWPRWRRCNEGCYLPQKKNTWFTRPLFWVPIGGAGVIGTVAGGDDRPAAIASTPPPPINTTTSSPPASPAPPVRRPASTLTVSGCLCVDNSAAFDAVLQLCQRLRQIRTQGSGNALTLTGDAPLPVFQGTFNESTGAFELTATTTVGTALSTVVISGIVETDGRITNARVSFGGAAGRQTLYTLTLTPVP